MLLVKLLQQNSLRLCPFTRHTFPAGWLWNWGFLVQLLRSSQLNLIKRRTPVLVPVVAIALFGSKPSEEDKRLKIKEAAMAQRKEIIENADQLFDESNFQECHDLLFALEDEEDAEVLWRKARVLQKLAKIADKKQKEDYIRRGFKFVEKAMKLDDSNFAIHKWYAILLDCNSELDGIKARVSQLANVKHHMTRATELNPQDPTSWYILGEFEYGIADMPWYISKIVSTLFATPPSGTFEMALECFLKAEEAEPNFYCRNHLLLGKCYMQFKDNEKAKHYITLAANTKVKNYDDKITKEEAEQLLKKL